MKVGAECGACGTKAVWYNGFNAVHQCHSCGAIEPEERRASEDLLTWFTA